MNSTTKVPQIQVMESSESDAGMDSDSSASVYYSMVETDNSNVCDDQSTLEPEESPSSCNSTKLEKTLKRTKTPLLHSVLAKSVLRSPMVLRGSGKKSKSRLSSSTPNTTPYRCVENDINLVNREVISHSPLNFTKKEEGTQDIFEVVNQKLESIKLDLPEQANWRFTSPSNVAFAETDTKNPSPGQIQFEKTANQIGTIFEDLQAEAPPDFGRPSMAIQDFQMAFPLVPVKTPCKSKDQVLKLESEKIEIQKSTPEQEFERIVAEMQPENVEDVVPKKLKAPTAIPNRKTISSTFRQSIIPKTEPIPSSSTSNASAAVKRAKWATLRNVPLVLPSVSESRVLGNLKKWSPKVDLPSTSTKGRRSYLPTTTRRTIHAELKDEPKQNNVRGRWFAQPSTQIKPATINNLTDSAKKRKSATLKIATVNIGNRRSSFGYPVGKPMIRKSMVPRVAMSSNPESSVKPATLRRSVMPLQQSKSLPIPPHRSGAIPKPTFTRQTSKSDLQCKYCDKKFAIVKALDDHLTTKCIKIPSKDKKMLLTNERAAREVDVARRALPSQQLDHSEIASSSVASSTSMPPPRSAAVKGKKAERREHSGVTRTPTKLIVCQPCGLKFLNVIEYTNHMTSIHIKSTPTQEDPADY